MQWLIDTFASFADFLTSVFTGLLTVIKFIPQIITNLTHGIAYMPTYLTGFATITLIVLIIYLLAGRGGVEN